MITSLVFMILSVPPVIRDIDVDIGGVYLVKGPNYSGMCAISQLNHIDAFYVVNVVGKTVTRGIGIRTGEHLAITWSDGSHQGITLYRIMGKTLTGRWTQAGDTITREQLIYLSELP